MQFDDGEVLQGLQVNWTFLGANLMEWSAGFMVFILCSLFAEPGRVGVAVPFMVIGWVCTTVALASVRKMFPDEERGMRNALIAFCGFAPMDIPAPSSLQPLWSAAPITELPEEWLFTQIGMGEILPTFQRQYLDEEED